MQSRGRDRNIHTDYSRTAGRVKALSANHLSQPFQPSAAGQFTPSWRISWPRCHMPIHMVS